MIFLKKLLSCIKQVKNKNIFFLIISLGLILRVFFIFKRNIVDDELSYFYIAQFTSLKNIIFIQHWIKDHAILYYIFLKIFIPFTKDIILLRLSNLLLYFLSALIIFLLFDKSKDGYFGVFLILIYSLHPYFIFLNSLVSPYNLVVFFSFLNLMFLFSFFVNNTMQHQLTLMILIIVTAILTFYADYSSFYLFFIYFFTLLFSFFTNKDLFKKMLVTYLIIFMLISPGLVQLLLNLQNIKSLNPFFQAPSSLLDFFYYFNQVFFLKNYSVFPYLFAIILFCLPILIYFLKIKNKMNKLFPILIFSFIINIILLFFVNKLNFKIFGERTFWSFYLEIILIISLSSYVLIKNKMYLLSLFIISIFLAVTINSFFNIHRRSVSGAIYNETDYIGLLKKIIKYKNIKTIIMIDSFYNYIVIPNYFFSPSYPSTGILYKELSTITKNPPKILAYHSCKSFLNKISNQNIVMIINFDETCTKKQLNNLKNSNIIIIQEKIFIANYYLFEEM